MANKPMDSKNLNMVYSEGHYVDGGGKIAPSCPLYYQRKVATV